MIYAAVFIIWNPWEIITVLSEENEKFHFILPKNLRLLSFLILQIISITFPLLPSSCPYPFLHYVLFLKPTLKQAGLQPWQIHSFIPVTKSKDFSARFRKLPSDVNDFLWDLSMGTGPFSELFPMWSKHFSGSGKLWKIYTCQSWLLSCWDG